MRPATPLRLAIVASGIRQKELAARVGLSESRMSMIANGLHCDDATRHKIALALGRTVTDLWPDHHDQEAA